MAFSAVLECSSERNQYAVSLEAALASLGVYQKLPDIAILIYKCGSATTLNSPIGYLLDFARFGYHC